MTFPASISVVVPAYNHERFIGEALASLQAQTLASFEVVVVDDGSQDATATVADQFARSDARFRVLRQVNAGSHAAINRGINETRGGWIAILNSDDRFAPTRLARLREQGEDGASFVVTAVRLIDEAGNEITDPRHWWLTSVRAFDARAIESGPVDGLLFGNYTVSTSNFFFSRSLFNEVGPFRRLRFILDWDWALRAALHAPTAIRYLAGEKLLDYRLHGRNTILRGALRGGCEVNRLHRDLLHRYGVPAGVTAALFRNQRLLRQNWRARGEATAEKYVRAREADIALLREQIGAIERRLREQIEAVERQLLERERFVRAREADIAQLQREAAERERTVEALRERLVRIEQSRVWRTLTWLRRLAGRASD